jgi:hypothetical protein
MTDDTASRPQGASGDILDVLRFSLKAVGVAGVFALVGYIVVVAHAEYLGIPSDAPTVSELSLAAAQFLFDSTVILLQRAQVHWFVTLVTLGLLGVLCWTRLAQSGLGKRLHFASELAIVAVLATVSTSTLLAYELPAIQLRNLILVWPLRPTGCFG